MKAKGELCEAAPEFSYITAKQSMVWLRRMNLKEVLQRNPAMYGREVH
jgi:hypothetical protein